MKKGIFLLGAIVVPIGGYAAGTHDCQVSNRYGQYCDILNQSNVITPVDKPIDMSNCATVKDTCYGGIATSTCTKCDTGYVLTDRKSYFYEYCIEPYTWQGCARDCSDVTCDSGYTANPNNNCKCECSRSCSEALNLVLNESKCECECKAGYYRPGGLALGCSACPKNNPNDSIASGMSCGVAASSSKTGKEACYYKSWASVSTSGPIYCSYSDETGKFQYTSSCYYSE